MIRFKRIVHYKDHPDHPMHQTNLYLEVGKLHILVYHKPAMGINVGWDCKFWHTGWHLTLSTNCIKWIWNKTYDYI